MLNRVWIRASLAALLLAVFSVGAYAQTTINVVPMPVPKSSGNADNLSFAEESYAQVFPTSTPIPPSPTQRTVVVISLGGEEAPNFRIISEGGKVYEGRLEYTPDSNPTPTSHWGTVCHDEFNENDNAANAICMDMGYDGGTLLDSSVVEDGNGIVMLDDVVCPANASGFKDCTSLLLEGNCYHGEDVGVSCTPAQSVLFRIIPEAGGAGPGDGRLEARLDSTAKPFKDKWGTVCDDDFELNDYAANAVCQDLGYLGGVLRLNTDTTDGTLPIYMDDVVCPVDAESISDCMYVFGGDDCGHHEDVGVTCSNNGP